METLGKYLSMSDSQLEGILSKEKAPKSRLAKMAGAAALGAATLLAANAGAAQGRYIIPKMDVTVACQGQEDQHYTGLMDQALIDVEYGCDIILDNPTVVKDTKGNNPIETDFLIKNARTKKFLANSRPLAGKSDKAFPTVVGTEDAGMAPGDYNMFVAAEKDATAVLASATLNVHVTKPQHRITPDRVRNVTPAPVPAPAPENKLEGSEPRASMYIGAFAGQLKFTPVENPDPEDTSFGIEIGGEYETRDAEIFGSVSWEQFSKRVPYLSDVLHQTNTGYSGGAHVKKAFLMAGGELYGGNSGMERESFHMMGSYGLPKDTTFGFEGRAGISIGDFNSATNAQAFVRVGRETREHAIVDIRYGDLVQDSITSNTKGIGIVARVNDALRASFYKTKASHELLESDDTQVSVEVSKGLGKDKNFRPYARFTYLNKKETGPEAQVINLNYNRFSLGVRMNWGKKR